MVNEEEEKGAAGYLEVGVMVAGFEECGAVAWVRSGRRLWQRRKRGFGFRFGFFFPGVCFGCGFGFWWTEFVFFCVCVEIKVGFWEKHNMF